MSRRRKKPLDKQHPKVTIISYDEESDDVEVLLEVGNNNLTCKFPRNSIPRSEEVEEDLVCTIHCFVLIFVTYY